MSRSIVTTNPGTLRPFERTPAPHEVSALFEPYDSAVTPPMPDGLASQPRRPGLEPRQPAIARAERRSSRLASAAAPWAIALCLLFVGLRLPEAGGAASSSASQSVGPSPVKATPSSPWVLSARPSKGALVVSVAGSPPEEWIDSVSVLVSTVRWSSTFSIALDNSAGSIRIPVVTGPTTEVNVLASGDAYSLHLVGSADVSSGVVPAWAEPSPSAAASATETARPNSTASTPGPISPPPNPTSNGVAE